MSTRTTGQKGIDPNEQDGCASARGASGGWHLKREIQVGHLLTTLTIIASVALYVTKMDQRLAIVESTLQHQQQRDAKQDESAAQSDALIRAQLSRMDEKLDRVIERLSAAAWRR